MKFEHYPFALRLRHEWTIASRPKAGGGNTADVIIIQLTEDGLIGLGEAAPSLRYGESPKSVQEFYGKIEPSKLSFSHMLESMDYIENLAPGNHAAKAGLNIALLDGAARRAKQPIYDFLNLGFTEGKHITSFSIGIDQPNKIKEKVLEAESYPILKLKVGSPNDRANLAALRQAARDKRVRVDANEAWTTPGEALKQIEFLAQDSHIEFVEQPMPAKSALKDLIWLKERSPLPIFADESYHTAQDVDFCAQAFHGINVKLVKTGGINNAFIALQAARKAGLKTMIGCMIESSILIAAAAHLAELADHLDIDGNLLVSNDPFSGPTADKGVISFTNAAEPFGLRVSKR